MFAARRIGIVSACGGVTPERYRTGPVNTGPAGTRAADAPFPVIMSSQVPGRYLNGKPGLR